MSYQKIKFMDRSNMHFLQPEKDAIVISITSSGLDAAKVTPGFKDILFLEFDNTDSLRHGMIRFSLDHAKSIMEFVEKNKDEAKTIYINCLQGETRSAAVAHFLADHYGINLKQDTSKELKWVYEVLARVNKWSLSRVAEIYKKK